MSDGLCTYAVQVFDGGENVKGEVLLGTLSVEAPAAGHRKICDAVKAQFGDKRRYFDYQRH